jgi:hypothetical protein
MFMACLPISKPLLYTIVRTVAKAVANPLKRKNSFKPGYTKQFIIEDVDDNIYSKKKPGGTVVASY